MTRLADLTYPEAAAIIGRGAVGLWPIGSTEAHGPHLPLSTDRIIAEEVCTRALPAVAQALQLEALILPPLSFTITEMARPFGGTLSIPRATVVAYVRDVLLAAAEHGFRALCLVNAHLEPAHRFALRDAVAEARPRAPCPIALADPADRRWADSLTEEFRSGSCHAGQYETSLLLAAAGPSTVREDLRARLAAKPIDLVAQIKAGARDFAQAGAAEAYCGTPADATAAEGERSYARLVEIVVRCLAESLSESP